MLLQSWWVLLGDCVLRRYQLASSEYDQIERVRNVFFDLYRKHHNLELKAIPYTESMFLTFLAFANERNQVRRRLLRTL